MVQVDAFGTDPEITQDLDKVNVPSIRRGNYFHCSHIFQTTPVLEGFTGWLLL